MNENDDCKKHKCEFCNYKTNRKFDLKKHHFRMHKCQIIENTSENLTGQNVHPNGQNVHPNGQNVHPNRQNVSLNQNICKKCNKIYMTKKIINI